MAEVLIPPSVLEHSRFFDRLVELIPASAYHEGEVPTQLRHLPREERQQEKTLRKEKAKAAKLARLDPSKAQTALQVQQQGRTTKPKKRKRDRDAASSRPSGKEGEEASASAGSTSKLEELRERLHKRLQAFREQRKADDKKQQIDKARQFQAGSRKLRLPPAAPSTKGQAKRKTDAGQIAEKAAAAEETPRQQFSYGALDFGEGPRKAKRQKRSKAELLGDAEKKVSDRRGMAGTTEGQARLESEAWGSAFARAKGEKVYDDPKLLRRSMKRDEKRRGKSAAAWRDRDLRVKKEQRDRQQKRRGNLQARIDAKQQKKVARREKKLMRPGFEGRRDTFINGP